MLTISRSTPIANAPAVSMNVLRASVGSTNGTSLSETLYIAWLYAGFRGGRTRGLY
jgi:hypothetical protein